MGAIGFLMKGSGIEEILSESGVCKKGTAEKVLNGKDYCKMLRCYSPLTEAIFGLLWIEFEQYVEDESIYTTINDLIISLSDSLRKKDCALTTQNCQAIKNELKILGPLWRVFVGCLGVTSKYYIMFIEKCK